MTPRPLYPAVDPRRLTGLRRALLRDIAALAPDWRGAQEETGPDRALVEIAARLGEQATRRLDMTPERDALAFLQTFDIAAPDPVAAEGFVVLALKDKQARPVEVPARTGLEIADLDGVKVPFETSDPIRVQPARIARLATVDPAADTIEIAPAAVTTPDRVPGADIRYDLQSAVGPDDRAMTLSPPVGLAPGDLLRIPLREGKPLYATVAGFSANGLTEIIEALGVALDTDAIDPAEGIRLMARLDAFAMPDLQEHGVYLGDAELLNVKEPARITLRFQPVALAALLRAQGVRFEIWGTRDGDDDPAWHPLVPLAEPGTDLVLYKSWTGSVDEAELGERKSRWLRIKPTGKLAPDAGGQHPLVGPEAMASRIFLGVETFAPADAKGDTISQAALNGQPLSLLTPFLPFGAVPQRGDTFALAAPEAFTKPGATATLDFTLLDGTLLSVAGSQRFDDQRHLYGIGRNGRLQVLDLNRPEILWRELAGPPDDTGAVSGLKLDPGFGVRAYARTKTGGELAEDVVLARAVGGGFHATRIVHRPGVGAFAPEAVESGGWAPLPDLPADALVADEVPAVSVAPRFTSSYPAGYRGFVYAATASGLFFIELDDSGRPGPEWRKLAPTADAPTLPVSPRMTLVRDPTQADALNLSHDPAATGLAVDAEGVLWIFFAGPDHLDWHRPLGLGGDPIRLNGAAMPAGLYYPEAGAVSLAVAAATDSAMGIWKLSPSQAGPVTAQVERFVVVPEVDAAAPLALMAVLSATEEDLPHVLALGRSGQEAHLVEWAPYGTAPSGLLSLHRFDLSGLPKELTETSGPLAASLAAFDAAPRGLVALGGVDQGLIRIDLNPSRRLLDVADWVTAPAAAGSLAFVQRTTDGTRVIRLATVVGNRNGDEVLRIGDGGTDWTEEVVTWRVPDVSPVTVTLVETRTAREFVLRAPFGQVPPGLPDADDLLLVDADTATPLILVEPEDEPDRRLIVQPIARRDDDDGNHTDMLFGAADMAALAAVLGDGDDAGWRPAERGATHVGTPRGPFPKDRTLLEFDGNGDPIAAVGLFEDAGEVQAATPLGGGSNFVVLEQAWLTGAAPASGDLVKINAEGLSAEGQAVQQLSSGYSAPELSWEYFTGSGWKRLDAGFKDTTGNFGGGGAVSFTVPHDLAASEIGGQTDVWIRVRLVGGDYGRPRYIVTSSETGGVTTQTVTVSTDHMRPPEIATVTARFVLAPNALPQLVVARNNLSDLNQSAANRIGAAFALFAGAFAPPFGTADDPAAAGPAAGPACSAREGDDACGCGGRAGGGADCSCGKSRAPGAQAAGAVPIAGRALLIGLDRPLEPGNASLYVLARDRDIPAELVLETLGPGRTWTRAPLAGADPTLGLTRTGLLRFTVSAAPANIQLLGATLHWLRIRAVGQGAAGWAPSIEGLWLNGVPVVQARTVLQEPLGSSDGEPGLEKLLLKIPVLPDTLELRVRERLGSEEVAELRAAEGADAVLDAVQNLPGQWVRWRRVSSMADHGGDERVFLVDAQGRIAFGDGQEGRLVLAGRDNIRAFSYRSGGQRVETAAFAKAGVRGSVEGLETVLAPSAIAGGRELPGPAELVARMPAVLRHAGDGLSLSDIEALARDIDSEIVQVRAFPPVGGGAPVLLSVLARGAGREPVYSPARRDALARALQASMSQAWPGSCLAVASVDFVPVTVGVRLVARPGRLAELGAEARECLDRFLHAALGGPDGLGWPPGRPLRAADIRRALADLSSFDRALDVVIRRDGAPLGDLGPREVITTRETRDISIEVTSEVET